MRDRRHYCAHRYVWDDQYTKQCLKCGVYKSVKNTNKE